MGQWIGLECHSWGEKKSSYATQVSPQTSVKQERKYTTGCSKSNTLTDFMAPWRWWSCKKTFREQVAWRTPTTFKRPLPASPPFCFSYNPLWKISTKMSASNQHGLLPVQFWPRVLETFRASSTNILGFFLSFFPRIPSLVSFFHGKRHIFFLTLQMKGFP